ncbi:hypothetical protein ABIB34_002994 [Rhodococcus sp. UYP5]
MQWQPVPGTEVDARYRGQIRWFDWRVLPEDLLALAGCVIVEPGHWRVETADKRRDPTLLRLIGRQDASGFGCSVRRRPALRNQVLWTFGMLSIECSP